MAKRIKGKDLYKELTGSKLKKPLRLSYWDLWIAIVLEQYHAKDWEKLLASLRRKIEKSYSMPYDFEALANHIRLLRQTLDDAGLDIEDILAGAEPDFLKKQQKKAYSKVLEMSFEEDEKTTWMIRTPRELRKIRAMRGHWDRFPVSPEEYANSLTRRYKTSGYYNEDQSFALKSKLAAFLEKQTARAALPEQFAVYRAFLTVVIEKMEMVDDSCGVIGNVYEESLKTYYELERTKLTMPPEDFLQDILELFIWEDYGFTDRERPNFFAGLSAAEVPIAEGVLQQQMEELKELEIEYQAEKALTLLGMLNVQQQHFDRFVPLAEIMGSREWQRITTMSEMAEQHQRYDLARQVYEAALQPGMHKSFLRKKYNELKRRLSTLDVV